MTHPNRDTPPQPPLSKGYAKPHPALARLDRLVGRWDVSDPSGAAATGGQIVYAWLPGGRYLLHHVDLTESQGLEVIGYDAASDSLKAHYFEGTTGQLLEYTYALTDDTLTISFDKMDGQEVSGQFVGRFSSDDTLSGRWEWVEHGETKGYDVTYRRLN